MKKIVHYSGFFNKPRRKTAYEELDKYQPGADSNNIRPVKSLSKQNITECRTNKQFFADGI